jgi:uncharacterized protein YodC (DUF2158 family)
VGFVPYHVSTFLEEIKLMNGGFVVGDTVQLKSGGPIMTLERFDTIDGAPSGWCTWFDDSKRVQAEFTLQALKKSEPSGMI